MQNEKSIAIVGAGLVGSLWAVLLRRRGYRVTVFEKRSDPRNTVAQPGRSINLVMTSRGLFGLEKAELLKGARALSVPVFGRQIHSRTGDTVFQPYGQDNECNHSISRLGLNQFLVEEAAKLGAEFHFQHALTEWVPETNTLGFNVGGEIARGSFDLVFGADGAGSRVRKLLCESFPAAFNEQVDWLEADYKELVLPAGAKGKPVLDPKALHIWPRGNRMMMALANLDGTFTVTLYLPKRGDASFESLKGSDAVKAFFASEFPDAVALMPRYAQEFLEHPQGELGTVRCTRWVYRHQVALIGDAAHAIVPFFGQGMNCGFEDCTTLLDLLDGAGGDWAVALEAYQQKRPSDAAAIAEMAIENWAEMRDRVGDPRFLLRKKVEGWLETQFPQVYKSRYGMITYTLVPYRLAREAGQVQEKLLAKLCEGIQSTDQLRTDAAQALLQAEWAPFVTAKGLDLEPYLR